METKFKVTEMEEIRRRAGFDSCLAVDCNGTGRDRVGGIAMLWQASINLFIT